MSSVRAVCVFRIVAEALLHLYSGQAIPHSVPRYADGLDFCRRLASLPERGDWKLLKYPAFFAAARAFFCAPMHISFGKW